MQLDDFLSYLVEQFAMIGTGDPGDPDESYEFWVLEVRELYLRVDMEVDEFEALMAVALTGRRPDDDRLPAYAPLGDRKVPNPLVRGVGLPIGGNGYGG